MLFLGNMLTKESNDILTGVMEPKKKLDKQLTTFFKLSEFKYVEPEEDLLRVLEVLRAKLNNPLIITDSTRSIEEHIAIYKNKFKSKWLEHIPWRSRHLPKFNTKLRGVDLKVTKGSNERGETSFYTGKEIYKLLQTICSRLNIFFGCGVGEYYVHLDVKRKRNVIWYYTKV